MILQFKCELLLWVIVYRCSEVWANSGFWLSAVTAFWQPCKWQHLRSSTVQVAAKLLLQYRFLEEKKLVILLLKHRWPSEGTVQEVW